jgi:hypothetical protein
VFAISLTMGVRPAAVVCRRRWPGFLRSGDALGGVRLGVDQETRVWIAEKGYDPLMGAHPMARVIKNHIKKPLAKEDLFGAFASGGSVRVYVKDGALDFEMSDAGPTEGNGRGKGGRIPPAL